MKSRLFIAIPISKTIQSEAVKFQKKYKDLDVRWLFGHNFHITLIPPWYEDDIERVKEVLNKLTNQIGPFNIEFHKVMFGPNRRHPRLIWAEGPVPEELTKLKRKLRELLIKEKVVKTFERRSFRLHMTIARFRPEKFKTFRVKEIDEKVDWKQKVDSLNLMQSHLTRTHAEYKTLHEVKI